MKAIIYTLGCKVNAYESEVIADLLRENGYQVTDEENADVCVVNTCTVTNNADKKSKKTINHAINRNPNSIVIVVGCFSQVKYEELSNNKRINIILGTSNKTKVIECINKYKETKMQIVDVNTSRNQVFEKMKIDHFDNKHRAFVKIQDGCNNFCTYCIIPFTRGTIRCKSFDVVIDEITSLVKNGFKEVVLTGIHTGSYMDSNHDFSDLLTEIVKINGLKRLRISSIEITELNDKFMDILKKSNVIVDHIHIPLQSGSDKILKLMNRKYDTSTYENIIKKIRTIRPNISITTDVIVGFPGEDEKDFIDMYKFIDHINFSSLHVFPYSKRDHTKAALMDNQVNENVKADRVKKLLILKERKELEYMSKFVGEKLDVLFETSNMDEYIGHTSNYLKVKVNSKKNITGKIENVVIDKIEYPICVGRLVSEVKDEEKEKIYQ